MRSPRNSVRFSFGRHSTPRVDTLPSPRDFRTRSHVQVETSRPSWPVRVEVQRFAILRERGRRFSRAGIERIEIDRYRPCRAGGLSRRCPDVRAWSGRAFDTPGTLRGQKEFEAVTTDGWTCVGAGAIQLGNVERRTERAVRSTHAGPHVAVTQAAGASADEIQ